MGARRPRLRRFSGPRGPAFIRPAGPAGLVSIRSVSVPSGARLGYSIAIVTRIVGATNARTTAAYAPLSSTALIRSQGMQRLSTPCLIITDIRTYAVTTDEA
jgi:hypothetical protein